MIKFGVQKNKTKFYSGSLNTGHVTIYDDNGIYIYRKYSNIIRVNKKEALIDAKNLVNENGIIG